MHGLITLVNDDHIDNYLKEILALGSTKTIDHKIHVSKQVSCHIFTIFTMNIQTL